MDKDKQSIEIQEAYDELNQNLANYNTLFISEQFLAQTRKGFWVRLINCISADASGALMSKSSGGFIGTIFSAIYIKRKK